MIVVLNNLVDGEHVATLSLPFPPRSGDRIYLSYEELLRAEPFLEPGQRLTPHALKKLEGLDGTTWEIDGIPVWEMRFHTKGQYDPSYRVSVRQVTT